MSAMMKLKVKKSFMLNSEPTKVGDVVHVATADAKYIIWRGMAEEVKDTPVAKDAPEVKAVPEVKVEQKSEANERRSR